MAYEENGDRDKAVAELKKAVELKSDEIDTMDDLADLYARTGRFSEQTAMLEQAAAKNPNDDHIAQALMNADLIEGKFSAAQDIVNSHKFLPVHRTYGLRDEYRELKFGMGAEAFNKGNYEQALQLFEAALKPPTSLGMDDFEFQSTPQIHYYIGRALEALGRKDEATKAYEQSADGYDRLTGDTDSLSSENFYMILSLDKLGHHQEAAKLLKKFQGFAELRIDAHNPQYRARSHYMLGQIDLYNGQTDQAKKEMAQAVQIELDFIGPRFELTGNAIDPTDQTASR